MKEIIIDEEYSEMRLDRFCLKIINVSKGEIQKNLRTGKIKVNGKKEKGSYRTKIGDKISFYITETQFIEKEKKKSSLALDIIYEDDNVVCINKPVGVLSQGSKKNDESVVSFLNSYIDTKQNFNAGIITRLDRNTSGIIISGKNRRTLMLLNELNRERKIEKIYLALVKGNFNKEGISKHYAQKDNKKNILKVNFEMSPRYEEILTEYKLLSSKNGVSLVSARLITGKSHQIRSQLSYMGFPIIGDVKYGDKKINEEYKEKYNLTYQFLHSYEAKFKLNDKNYSIKAKLPDDFYKIIKDLKLAVI